MSLVVANVDLPVSLDNMSTASWSNKCLANSREDNENNCDSFARKAGDLVSFNAARGVSRDQNLSSSVLRLESTAGLVFENDEIYTNSSRETRRLEPRHRHNKQLAREEHLVACESEFDDSFNSVVEINIGVLVGQMLRQSHEEECDGANDGLAIGVVSHRAKGELESLSHSTPYVGPQSRPNASAASLSPSRTIRLAQIKQKQLHQFRQARSQAKLQPRTSRNRHYQALSVASVSRDRTVGRKSRAQLLKIPHSFWNKQQISHLLIGSTSNPSCSSARRVISFESVIDSLSGSEPYLVSEASKSSSATPSHGFLDTPFQTTTTLSQRSPQLDRCRGRSYHNFHLNGSSVGPTRCSIINIGADNKLGGEPRHRWRALRSNRGGSRHPRAHEQQHNSHNNNNNNIANTNNDTNDNHHKEPHRAHRLESVSPIELAHKCSHQADLDVDVNHRGAITEQQIPFCVSGGSHFTNKSHNNQSSSNSCSTHVKSHDESEIIQAHSVVAVDGKVCNASSAIAIAIATTQLHFDNNHHRDTNQKASYQSECNLATDTECLSLITQASFTFASSLPSSSSNNSTELIYSGCYASSWSPTSYGDHRTSRTCIHSEQNKRSPLAHLDVACECNELLTVGSSASSDCMSNHTNHRSNSFTTNSINCDQVTEKAVDLVDQLDTSSEQAQNRIQTSAWIDMDILRQHFAEQTNQTNPATSYPNNTLLADLSKCHQNITSFWPSSAAKLVGPRPCWSTNHFSGVDQSNKLSDDQFPRKSYVDNFTLQSHDSRSEDQQFDTTESNNKFTIRIAKSDEPSKEKQAPSNNYEIPLALKRSNVKLSQADYHQAIGILTNDARYQLHILLYGRVQALWVILSSIACVLVGVLLTNLGSLAIGACLIAWLSLQLIGLSATSKLRHKLDKMLERSVAQVNTFFMEYNLMLGVINIGGLFMKNRLLIPILYFDTSQCREQIESIISSHSSVQKNCLNNHVSNRKFDVSRQVHQESASVIKEDDQQVSENCQVGIRGSNLLIGNPLEAFANPDVMPHRSTVALAQSQMAKKILLRYSQRWISHFDKQKLMFTDERVRPRHLSTGKCLCQFIEEQFSFRSCANMGTPVAQKFKRPKRILKKANHYDTGTNRYDKTMEHIVSATTKRSLKCQIPDRKLPKDCLNDRKRNPVYAKPIDSFREAIDRKQHTMVVVGREDHAYPMSMHYGDVKPFSSNGKDLFNHDGLDREQISRKSPTHLSNTSPTTQSPDMTLELDGDTIGRSDQLIDKLRLLLELRKNELQTIDGFFFSSVLYQQDQLEPRHGYIDRLQTALPNTRLSDESINIEAIEYPNITKRPTSMISDTLRARKLSQNRHNGLLFFGVESAKKIERDDGSSGDRRPVLQIC